MAKKTTSTYAYPSRFGSHSSMIIKEEGDKITCEDEFGTYQTDRSYIDKNMADPNRTSQKRLKKLFEGKKDKENK